MTRLIQRLVGDTPQIPTATSHKSKKQQSVIAAKAAADAAAAEAAVQADVIALGIPSLPIKEIALGPVRHRLLEPLLVGKGRGGESVWEGMGRAMESPSLNSSERMAIWEGVGVVGEIARIRGKQIGNRTGTYPESFRTSFDDLPRSILTFQS